MFDSRIKRPMVADQPTDKRSANITSACIIFLVNHLSLLSTKVYSTESLVRILFGHQFGALFSWSFRFNFVQSSSAFLFGGRSFVCCPIFAGNSVIRMVNALQFHFIVRRSLVEIGSIQSGSIESISLTIKPKYQTNVSKYRSSKVWPWSRLVSHYFGKIVDELMCYSTKSSNSN